jgi:hypothetical protein
MAAEEACAGGGESENTMSIWGMICVGLQAAAWIVVSVDQWQSYRRIRELETALKDVLMALDNDVIIRGERREAWDEALRGKR